MLYHYFNSKLHYFFITVLSINFLPSSIAMKALIQRVANASVTVNEEIVSSIGRGLCVFIGIHRDDKESDIEFIVRKILNMRLFESNDGSGRRWSTNVAENDYEILCVSQFTLYHTLKGNKADFHHAMNPTDAEPFYNQFLIALRSQYKECKIKDGKFGALMQVNLVNDGPVTLQIESPPPKN